MVLSLLTTALLMALWTTAWGDEWEEFPGLRSGPDLGSPVSDQAQSTDDLTSAEEPTPNEKLDSTQNPDTPEEPGALEESDTPEDLRTTEPSAETEPAAEGEPPTEPEESQPPEPTQQVGEPLASGMVELLQREILTGLQRRGILADFARFCRYAGAKLDATAHYSGSELKGNCRLRWYDHLLRNPLKAPAEAEEFTRLLHRAVLDDRQGLAKVLATAGEKLDLSSRGGYLSPEVDSPEQALDVIQQAVIDCQASYCAALAPLSRQEIQELAQNLYPVLTGQNQVGHTLQSRGSGSRLCSLMEKLDRGAMHAAAEALLPIADPKLLEQLKALPDAAAGEGDPEAQSDVAAEDDPSADEDRPDSGQRTFPGVSGPIVRCINTPGGTIVIGGRRRNVYQLDKMPGVSVVIDLGGDDVYFEGTVSPRRPVLVVIDLAGNDGYRGERPGVQGAAVMGVSMLLDVAGDDVYYAKDVGQGSCLAGAGILIDYAGNDTYVGVRRVQGEAVGGVGILIDRAGNDRYHAAMWAQGFGGPLGFGLLDDVDGKDHYYGGGLYINSYADDENPTPGYEGWAQGVGAGLRQVSDGGIGVILDGGGDDVYEYDYLSHGGGYWCGVGFARDFAGNDQRLGATRKAYNGGPRTQRRFQRFGTGFGCHYALGFLFDDQGDDTYNGSMMCVGYAWDCSVGYLCDFGGNDGYSGNEGNGAQAGLGVVFDYDGDDVYNGYSQGNASSGISYHSLPECGGNFSFVVDYGGTDKYGSGARNNSYLRRNSSGGFLIDRPKQDATPGHVARTARKPGKKPAARPSVKTASKPGGKTAAKPAADTAKQSAAEDQDHLVRRLPPVQPQE